MWSQLHSHVAQEKVVAAKELLTDAKLRPVWIFEALGPKPWGESVEVVECWLTLVDLLPKQYPLAKSGGLRPLSDALNNPDCRDLLAQCLERLIDRDAVLIDQAIMVQKVVGDHVDTLAINAAQFLTTAFVRSRITRKSFQSILEHVPRLWHLDGCHLQGLFDLLFADPEGFKKVDGLKKQKLADKANNVLQSSYHGGFFDFVKLHRNNAHLHRLLPQMLQTFFAHWQERRKTLHSVQIDGTQGVKRQREELKAKFDTGFFFMELLVDALVESSAGDDAAVSCVNSLWRMCASCNAFRKDEKSDLLKTYVKFLVEREKKENGWTGLEICLSLDATCLEEHFPALIKHSCPPSFSRAAVNAHAQRHDIGGLLTLLEGDCPWEGLGEALRDALTLCLPEQTCDLLQSLAKCPGLLATVLEGNFAVTEQTAPEVYAVIQNFPLTSRRAFLAKQAALRRLAKWTGNGMEDLRFRTPSSGSVTIEERLTVQLHRAALGKKKKITDISVFSEADWELVRPHLPLLSTIEDLRPILRQRLLPEDLAVAFETEVFTDFDIKQWAHRACKDFSFSKEMPPEYLPNGATINRRKWSEIEKIEIFERLPPGPDVQRAMGNVKEAKWTREDALKHPIDKMSKALIATSGAWKYEELVVAWTLIEKSILSFHDYELLHKLLLQTRCYRRLWTRATKICLNAALWSSEPAQTLLTLLRLAPPRGGQPPWVKRIPSVLACVRKVTEMVYTASCGEEAQKRSRLAVRVWQAVASGNVRWAPSVGCKKLQMALKNYIWFLVACFLDCDRSFVGPEMASKSGLLEDVAAWREAQKILQQGLLPLLEMMDDRQKQALYAQLQEPMKSMFREANAGFKKHGFYTGKY